MINKQRKTIVMPYDDMGITEPVMRCMSSVSEYGVSLTDVIGYAAECVLTPRNKPVEAHVCENIDPYYFDQSSDPNGEDPYLVIDGRRVEFEDFHECLTDAVASVYDQVERTIRPVFLSATGGTVRSVRNPEGTNRVFLDIELGDD